MIKKIDHIGIAVRSLAHSLPFYTDILQLPLLKIEEVASEQVKIAFLQVGEVKLELLEPTSSTSTINKFLDQRGEGIHHIALQVESIETRIAEIKCEGIRMIHEEAKEGAGNSLIAFMHPKSTGGVLYELCEKGKQGEQQ